VVNATVFHVRTGDVVEDDERSVMELLIRGRWTGYVKPLAYYEGIRVTHTHTHTTVVLEYQSRNLDEELRDKRH